MEQEEVIRRFIARYNECLGSDYRITRWPDRDNRRSREIDAYAEEDGRCPLAIEHTNVESFRNQKLDSARFVKVIGTLETELAGFFRFGISLAVRVGAIQPGTDWIGVRAGIKIWLLQNANALPYGTCRPEIQTVPFPLTVSKERDNAGKIWVSRFAPPKVQIQVESALALAAALHHKYEQLNSYREAGAKTVLILESDDIALVNHGLLYAAFVVAAQCVPTPAIDQVWMARTYVCPQEIVCNFLCFRGSQRLMRVANPPNFLFGQEHAPYWQEVVSAEPSLMKARELMLGQVTS